MRKETWKVMFACAVGAFIGALIGLEVKPWLLWVGFLTGGLTGYLCYDLRRVLGAIPAAYRAARGWKPDKLYWQSCFFVSLALFSLFSWSLLFLFLPVIFSDGLAAILAYSDKFFWLTVTLLTFSIGYGAALAALQDEKVTRGTAKYKEHHERMASLALGLVIYSAVPIILFYHLPRGLWWVGKRTPRAIPFMGRATGRAVLAMGRCFIAFIRFLGRFSWQLFIRIHSDERVLCGTDAMIGAAAGYLLGSAVVGALAGALVGLVNYEIVTRRWLVPKGYVAIRSK